MEAGDNQHSNEVPPIGGTSEPGVSQAEAADRLNVSTRTVTRAKKVQKDAIPEIQGMVEKGDLRVLPAAEVAGMSVEEQRAMAALGAEEITRIQAAKRAEAKERGRTQELQKEEDPGKEEEPQKNGKCKRRPVGIDRANEAINCLTRIPKNDVLRKRGLQRVMDWIRRNK